MSWSDTLENAILDHVLGGPDYSRVNTVWVGLSTAVVSDNANGLAEPSGNGYARVSVVNSSNNLGAAAAGVKQNAAIFTFPEATGSWGTVVHFQIWNHATNVAAANLIAAGSLAANKTIGAGDTPRFPVNSLSITQD
jgi:hypothetical protein